PNLQPSTLFPYTTLFRSASGKDGGRLIEPSLQVREHLEHLADSALGLGLAPSGGPGGHVEVLLHRQAGEDAAAAGHLHQAGRERSEEHTSELQSLAYLVC